MECLVCSFSFAYLDFVSSIMLRICTYRVGQASRLLRNPRAGETPALPGHYQAGRLPYPALSGGTPDLPHNYVVSSG